MRQTAAKCQDEPMPTETLLKSLEKVLGQGDQLLTRLQALIEHLDGEMINRNDGPVMRQLWAVVTDYHEKVLEARAAA